MIKFSNKFKLTAYVLLIGSIMFACGTDSNKKANGGSTHETTIEMAEEKTETPKPINDKFPTVIDFNATWCGPCKMIAPKFHELENEFSDRINFLSIDVDKETEMAEKYQVTSVPTFVFLNPEGKEIDRLIGADEATLTKKIKDLAN